MARLNAQGLSRKEPLLLRCIEAEPGNLVVSIDVSSGEPSVTSHYSGDHRYTYCTLTGVGKDPYYDSENVLCIDDIYLCVASVSPFGKQQIREAFDAQWPAGNFIDQWRKDSEVIKSKLKSVRQLHKILALGLGYGMGARKLVNTAYENGFTISFKEAKDFFNAYWQLFSGVRLLADRLAAQIKIDGYLVNEFGYRLTPDPRKAFNYWIQSSVSGIMHLFKAKLFALAPYTIFVTVIHDEIIAECPKEKIEEFRKAKDEAVRLLNEDLGWTVKLRMGFAPGETWYEAK